MKPKVILLAGLLIGTSLALAAQQSDPVIGLMKEFTEAFGPSGAEGPVRKLYEREMRKAGADVVGLNCIRGPQTMLPLLGPIREAVSCPVAALPVPYRTTEAEPSMQSLRDPARGGAQAFPTALDPFTCTRHELADFTTAALDLGEVRRRIKESNSLILRHEIDMLGE